MNKIIKKITSLVAALTVTLTSTIVFNMPKSLTAAAEGTHSHKACGGLAHGGCNHNDIVYEEFPTDNKEVMISSDKNYYLTRDLSNNDITRIYNLENIKLNLCLNGHKIVTEKAVFHPVSGAVLNICDCKGGGSIENTLNLQGVVQISEGGQANIYGGSFVGRMGSICMGDSNDVVNIYDGNFISNEPVYMYGGTLSIYGGEFTSKKTCVTAQRGNISVYDGKFICTAETDDYKYIIDAWYGVMVNIFDGKMTCEKAMGVRLFDSDCILNMSGGSIFSYGSAVLSNGNNTPKVNISGGSLCSDHAVTISGGALKMTGGTVSGFMGIGTGGEITGGTIKDCGYCGISVQQNCNVTIGGNAKFENNICDIYLVTADDIFTVKDDFQNIAAVRVVDDISEDTPRRITTNGTDENALSKITSCDDKYAVKYDDSSKYLYLNYHVHEYDENFKYDENGHWQLCEKCGEVGEKTSHTWDNGNVTKQPTENDKGVKTYTCEICKAERTEDIDMLEHEHTYSEDWTSDENNHWHAATCGHDVKSGKAPHIWDNGTVIKQPTENKTGEKRFGCTACGTFKTEIIPATGGSDTSDPDISDKGNIIKDVQLSGNVPKTTLATPLEELIAAVLTPEEQEMINNGIDIKIILTVNDATNEVSTEDKTAVQNKIGELKNYKLGQYLDLNLLKIIGDSEGVKITQTNKPISVTFEIPDALRGKIAYSVIRVHSGTATALNDLDSDSNTVTIETDKFSIYALAYQEKSTSTKPGEDDSNSSRPTTSDNSDNSSSDTPNYTSSNTSETSDNSSDEDSSSYESSHVPSESSTPNSGDNPETGITVSLIPLAAILSGVIAAVNRKKE